MVVPRAHSTPPAATPPPVPDCFMLGPSHYFSLLLCSIISVPPFPGVQGHFADHCYRW